MRELGVELILARSPQAKGRVERMNGTLQDRLVKALRQAGISDLAAANEFLENTFLPDLNARFTVPAACDQEGHVPLAATTDLGKLLSIQEERTVQNDWTVRWHNGFLQLSRATARHLQPGQRVLVCEQLDGQLRIFAGELQLSWSTSRNEPVRPRATKPVRTQPTGSRQGQKPTASHPWRNRFKTLPGPDVAILEGACSATPP